MTFSLRPTPPPIPMWVRLVLVAVLLAAIFGLASCEHLPDLLRDALPRTGRDVG